MYVNTIPIYACNRSFAMVVNVFTMFSTKYKQNESDSFPVNPEFAKYANIKTKSEYQDMVDQANNDYEAYWGRLAKRYITWNKQFTQVLDTTTLPFYKWFYDGELNISYNCLDRHLETKSSK